MLQLVIPTTGIFYLTKELHMTNTEAFLTNFKVYARRLQMDATPPVATMLSSLEEAGFNLGSRRTALYAAMRRWIRLNGHSCDQSHAIAVVAADVAYVQSYGGMHGSAPSLFIRLSDSAAFVSEQDRYLWASVMTTPIEKLVGTRLDEKASSSLANLVIQQARGG